MVFKLSFDVLKWFYASKVAAFLLSIFLTSTLKAQPAEELIQKLKTKLEKVNDYEAKGKMKTNVAFIKTPIAAVKIYYKKPNKLKINNESGISFIPQGTMNINLGNILENAQGFDIIDMGIEAETGLRILKLLPKDVNADIVLSTLYIDEAKILIRKSITTTRENGTYELEMTYGKYAEYGLADKVIFSFNTKDYKLPKGITFDYDDGSKKGQVEEKAENKKGTVEISYSSYLINKGVPDSVFK